MTAVVCAGNVKLYAAARWELVSQAGELVTDYSSIMCWLILAASIMLYVYINTFNEMHWVFS